MSIKELALGLTEPQRLASVGWNRGGGVVHSAHRLAHLAVYQLVNSSESHWVTIYRTSRSECPRSPVSESWKVLVPQWVFAATDVFSMYS